MPLIIVEGVDGSGKSTLIDELSHVSPDNAVIMHRGPLRRPPLQEYVADLKYMPMRGATVLCDRWHVGELVYGPLYRGKSQLTPAMQRFIEMRLDQLGALKLMIKIPHDVLEQRLAARGEDFLQAEHQHLVHDFYDDYAIREGWNLVGYDYDRSRYPKSLYLLAKRKESQAFITSCLKYYLGPPTPRTLIVHPSNPASPHPFFPATDIGADRLLGLLQLAAPRKSYGLCTTNNVGGTWLSLGKPKIVSFVRDGINMKPELVLKPPRTGDNFRQFAAELRKAIDA